MKEDQISIAKLKETMKAVHKLKFPAKINNLNPRNVCIFYDVI